MDIIRAVVLVLFSILIWCMIYNRWSAESWGTPISYLPDPSKEDALRREAELVPRGVVTQRERELQAGVELELARGDVLQQLATIKAARDGHILPVLPTNIPELGAPFIANWDDYPSTEKCIYWMTGLAAKFMGIFAAANFAALLEDILAALSFYAACRLLKYGWIWSFAGALVFAFARYGFSHQIHHIPTAYVWHVPLCFVVFLWIVSEGGIQFKTPRFVFAILVAFFTGMQSPYYTYMFAQFVVIGALVLWWRSEHWREWRIYLPAAAVIGAAAAAFLFMNLNTFLYHAIHGGNPDAVVRDYHWLEIYGLKLVDMVMPPPDHRFPPFADWGFAHILPGVIALQPGEMPPSGYLGIISLASLAWLVAVSLRRGVQGEKLPVEAWLVLWIYLYSGVGSINGVIGTLGFQLFRATTRYSIWILCIVLMYAIRRFSGIDFKSLFTRKFGATPWADWFPYGIAFAAVVIALWDQTPPITTQSEMQNIAAAQASDRNFTREMELNLPPNAMVFQLPIMQFPESPTTIGSYDNLRPYLYSRLLRYSFGTDKGRGTESWQFQIARSQQFISKLEQYGFAGLYVNRDAFPDRGEGLLQSLKSIGYDKVIDSAKKDLFCVLLKPSPHPILPDAYPTINGGLSQGE